MTRESLILFIERILQSGSEQKAFGALHELHEILTRQNADNGLISPVIAAIPIKRMGIGILFSPPFS